MPRSRTKPRRTAKSTTSLRARIAELERERELLNAIANYAPSLICLVDAEGRVRPHATNRAFERILGYQPHETGGVHFWERYVPDGARAAARGRRWRRVRGPLAAARRRRDRRGVDVHLAPEGRRRPGVADHGYRHHRPQ